MNMATDEEIIKKLGTYEDNASSIVGWGELMDIMKLTRQDEREKLKDSAEFCLLAEAVFKATYSHELLAERQEVKPV